MYERLGTVPPPLCSFVGKRSHKLNPTFYNRAKIREKTLERELARIAGENWQVRLFSSPQ